ncbi:hypothetical protein PTKU46_59090 [Paraburkholderia terrae]
MTNVEPKYHGNPRRQFTKNSAADVFDAFQRTVRRNVSETINARVRGSWTGSAWPTPEVRCRAPGLDGEVRSLTVFPRIAKHNFRSIAIDLRWRLIYTICPAYIARRSALAVDLHGDPHSIE